MKKRVFTVLAFSVIAASSLMASEFQALNVTVPFAFTAGKASLPAGSYTVVEGSAHMVTIRGNGSRVSVYGTPSTGAVAGTPSLSFERTARGYVLKAIQSPGLASTQLAAAK